MPEIAAASAKRAGGLYCFADTSAQSLRSTAWRAVLSRPHVLDAGLDVASLRINPDRVGVMIGTKQLDENTIRLAVIAHVRHQDTDYDALLGRGVERNDARQRVQARIEQVLSDWETPDAETTG